MSNFLKKKVKLKKKHILPALLITAALTALTILVIGGIGSGYNDKGLNEAAGESHSESGDVKAASGSASNDTSDTTDSNYIDKSWLKNPDATDKNNDRKRKKLKEVDFDIDRAFEYCEDISCKIKGKDKHLSYELTFEKYMPKSDDDLIYLLEIPTYDKGDARRAIATAAKGHMVEITAPLMDRYIFEGFVPALLCDGEYVAIAPEICISNPEALCQNQREYYQVDSKKGVLLDGDTLGTDTFYDLNVKRVVYNMPLSMMLGETDDEEHPTIEYEYDGKKYLFNGYKCWVYDSLFSYLASQGYHTTVIILNDWNREYPQLIHPKSRTRTGASMYYAFNTEEEDGVRLMEATASFLAERYAGGDHGMVYDWVIANEINQQKIWNYMATDDLDYYTDSFEKSFRTFYNAIRANYSKAHVCFSIDHDWNDNYGNNARFFNGRELLYAFNEKAMERGNYDWGLSIHPYPTPLTKTGFWKGDYDKSSDAPVVTPMNLSALTDVMVQDDFLNTKGDVRNISVTELGFSSRAGESLQAAAFAYCYYIIEDNEYIDSFLLNRETDDAESLKSGLSLGIYNKDYSAKEIAEVFGNIDSKKGEKYIPQMLEIIGATSLEEALSWAR